uniref:Uncharacterized protein n=1 Tax=Anguilla anguilla TaxID=7936 RepID=A0A0E9T858_ANGAN
MTSRPRCDFPCKGSVDGKVIWGELQSCYFFLFWQDRRRIAVRGKQARSRNNSRGVDVVLGFEGLSPVPLQSWKHFTVWAGS